VILASANDGDNLYPLTDAQPLPLLPVANRPILSYQLEMLERAHGFTEVLIVTYESNLPQLHAYASEVYKGPLRLELVTVPEGFGSADALRHLRSKLRRDFVLLSGDVITDLPFQQIADLHRLHGAAATALFKEQQPRDGAEKKKARALDGADFVGTDEKRQRLLHLEAAADCEQGLISVSQALLRAYPHVQVHTGLTDAHVYVLAHWTLSVLELKPNFGSVKFELLPYLVRKQFLSQANLSITPAKPRALQVKGSSALRCCCYVMAHDAGYCQRVNSLASYMQANLDLARGGVSHFDKAPEPNEQLKEGNFAAKSFSAECARGAGVEVGGRSSIKKSTVGPHCRIGSSVKLTNCVLMDHVVLHDKVSMSNVVVCSDAEIGEGASLKDAQVARGVTVEAGAVIKGEVVTGETESDQD